MGSPLSKRRAGQAAIDLERGSVVVGRALREHERDGVAELLGPAEPARRDFGDQALLPRGARDAVLAGVETIIEKRGLCRARHKPRFWMIASTQEAAPAWAAARRGLGGLVGG